MLKDLIGGNIESRIFLNEHLTPSSKKLVEVCKQLKLKQKLKRYTHLNYNIPKVRVELMDVVENMLKLLSMHRYSERS